MQKKLAVGNWKMNGFYESLAEFSAMNTACPAPACDVLICPPTTLIRSLVEACDGTGIQVGGQDCHEQTSGAHTGDISAHMLVDAGATHVILGHSERRASYGESDLRIRAKATTAWNASLTAIVCIGETLDERKAFKTLDIVGGQLAMSVPDGATAKNLVIAYEPIWAIGTGKTPTVEEIEEVHTYIRVCLKERFGSKGANMRILYGGSMTPENACSIATVPNVDGGLIGGASLKRSDFMSIVQSLKN